jgi:hypothetical protein
MEDVMRRLIILWLLSLAVVALISSAVTAQINRTPPRIVSGSDIGVRVEGTDPASGRPVGALVIRVNGDWLEVTGGIKVSPVHPR